MICNLSWNDIELGMNWTLLVGQLMKGWSKIHKIVKRIYPCDLTHDILTLVLNVDLDVMEAYQHTKPSFLAQSSKVNRYIVISIFVILAGGVAGVCAALFIVGVSIGAALAYKIFYFLKRRKTTWVRAPCSEEDTTVVSSCDYSWRIN